MQINHQDLNLSSFPLFIFSNLKIVVSIILHKTFIDFFYAQSNVQASLKSLLIEIMLNWWETWAPSRIFWISRYPKILKRISFGNSKQANSVFILKLWLVSLFEYHFVFYQEFENPWEILHPLVSRDEIEIMSSTAYLAVKAILFEKRLLDISTKLLNPESKKFWVT